jgi:hypothetical protein
MCERARSLGAGRRRKPLMHMTASPEIVVNIRRLFASVNSFSDYVDGNIAKASQGILPW